MDIKKLAGLLYDMGKVFEDYKGTRLSTEEFLRTGNTDVLSTVQNRDLMLDLKECSRIALDYDYEHKPFDHTLLQDINSGITRTASLHPGIIRNDTNIGVKTIYGIDYDPPIPNVNEVDDVMRWCDSNADDDITLAASNCFVRLSKIQLFWDGNKRTSLLSANGLFLKHGIDNDYFTVPSDSQSIEFNRLLSDYYLGRNDDVISWLAKINYDRLNKSMKTHISTDLKSLSSVKPVKSSNEADVDMVLQSSDHHDDNEPQGDIHVRSYDCNC